MSGDNEFVEFHEAVIAAARGAAEKAASDMFSSWDSVEPILRAAIQEIVLNMGAWRGVYISTTDHDAPEPPELLLQADLGGLFDDIQTPPNRLSEMLLRYIGIDGNKAEAIEFIAAAEESIRRAKEAIAAM